LLSTFEFFQRKAQAFERKKELNAVYGEMKELLAQSEISRENDLKAYAELIVWQTRYDETRERLQKAEKEYQDWLRSGERFRLLSPDADPLLRNMATTDANIVAKRLLSECTEFDEEFKSETQLKPPVERDEYFRAMIKGLHEKHRGPFDVYIQAREQWLQSIGFAIKNFRARIQRRKSELLR